MAADRRVDTQDILSYIISVPQRVETTSIIIIIKYPELVNMTSRENVFNLRVARPYVSSRKPISDCRPEELTRNEPMRWMDGIKILANEKGFGRETLRSLVQFLARLMCTDRPVLDSSGRPLERSQEEEGSSRSITQFASATTA